MLGKPVIMIGFNNGKYEEVEAISIPITSLSINRGYGAFEFFEIMHHQPFFGNRHLARFKRSMELMKLQIDFDDELQQIVDEIIQRNVFEHGYLKLFALPHKTGYKNFRQAALYVFPCVMPMYDPALYTEGARLLLKQHDRFLPGAKSTNYLAGQYWMDEQEDKRIIDVLYHDGTQIRETSRANIFVVKDGTVLTPGEGMLKGITRGLVLELMAEHGILHAEAEVSISLLLSAEEVFVSSTTKHIMPIVQIDNMTIGNGKPGPITKEIREAFLRLKHDHIKAINKN